MRWLERDRAAQWIVGFAAGLVYLNTLGNGFVFDDVVAIVQNPQVQDSRLLLQPFVTDYWRGYSLDLLYRPLTVFSFGLNRLVLGPQPWGFHLVNLLLHVLVCLVAFRLIRDLFRHRGLALATGLLFALHPIHTEAVANVVGRAELLMSLFTLLALQWYLDARAAPLATARRRFVACTAAVFLACLSKENGVVAPALIVLADLTWCLQAGGWGRFRGGELRRTLLCYVTLAGVAAIYLLIRLMVLGELSFAHEATQRQITVTGVLIGWPWPLQFANALAFFGRYLGLLCLPWRLSADYSYNQLPLHPELWHWDIGVGALALLALIAAAICAARRAPPVFFGIAFFLLAFLPVSNFILPILTTMAERVLYLPSLGLLLAASWLAVAALAESRHRANAGAASARRPLVIVLLALVIACFAVRTILRNRDWRDELALFASTVRACPDCANAHSCYADALRAAGRASEALAEFDRSLQILPGNATVLYRKADLLMQLGRRAEATQTMREAADSAKYASSKYLAADACDQLSHLALGEGKLDEALRWSMQAVADDPDRAVLRFNLGYLFQRKANLVEARRQYREAVRMNPDEPSFAFNLGLVCRDLGDLDAAVTQLQKAVDLSPQTDKYWTTLADTLLRKGAVAPAAQVLEQYVQRSTNAAMVAKAKEVLERIRPANAVNPK